MSSPHWSSSGSDDSTAARASQQSNPQVQGSSRVAMPAGKAWRFHHWIWRTAMHMDDDQEIPGPSRYYGYDEQAALHGKGRRTSTCVWDGIPCGVYQRWEYDARGRVTLAGQNAYGIEHHVFSAYDSADRLTTLTYYPTNEALTVTDDAAWRPTGMRSGQMLVMKSFPAAMVQPWKMWIHRPADRARMRRGIPIRRRSCTVSPAVFMALEGLRSIRVDLAALHDRRAAVLRR